MKPRRIKHQTSRESSGSRESWLRARGRLLLAVSIVLAGVALLLLPQGADLIGLGESEGQSHGTSAGVDLTGESQEYGPSWLRKRADDNSVDTQESASRAASIGTAGRDAQAGDATALHSDSALMIGARDRAGGATGITETSSESDAGPVADADEASGNSRTQRRKNSSGTLTSLAFKVLDHASGNALSGATISGPLADAPLQDNQGMLVIPSSGGSARATTDSQGTCTLSLGNSCPEVFRVVVQLPGKVSVVQRYQRSGLKQGQSITLRLHDALRVSGRVSNRKGETVSGASVTVSQGDDARQLNGTLTTTTDSAGTFALDVAAAYAYRLVVRASSYVPYTSPMFDFRRDEREVTVLLSEGQGVSGTVTADGLGLANATITAEDDNNSVVSDAQGRFELVSLKDRVWTNRIRVRVTHAERAPIVTDLLANDADVRIELPAFMSVAGSVLDEAGNPLAGATIESRLEQAGRTYPGQAGTSSVEGSFALTGFGPGKASLRARTQDGRFSPWASTTLSIAKSAATGVELRLGAGATLRGNVVLVTEGDNPAIPNGISVLLDGTPSAQVDTGSGTFTLSGLDAVKVSVSLTGNEAVPAHLASFGLFAAGGRFFTRPQPQSPVLQLGKETTLTFTISEFVPREKREITVEITLDSQADLQNLLLEAWPAVATAPGGAATSKIDTRFSLVQGRFSFQAELYEGVNYHARITHPRVFTRDITTQEVAAVQHGGVLRIQLTQSLALTGYVKNSHGAALVGAGVSVHSQGKATRSGTTDQLGFFEVGQLEPGAWRIRVFLHSYYEFWSENIDLTSDGERPPENIVLLGANEIRITVENASGTPVPGAHVSLSRPNSDNPNSPLEYFNIGETDARGKKIVNFHWIRHYQIQARHGGQIAFTNFANVKDQNVREFTLRLAPEATLSGILVSATSGQPVPSVDVYARLEAPGQEDRHGNGFYVRTNGNGAFTLRVPAGSNFTMVCRDSRAYKESETPGIISGQSDIRMLATPKDQVSGNWAEFISLSAPPQVSPGQEFTLTVIVLNRGSTTWSEASKHRIGSQSPRDNSAFGSSRLSLSSAGSIAPGQQAIVSVTMRAPAKAGTHTMQWQMVQDGKEWFGEYSPKVSIVVQ